MAGTATFREDSIFGDQLIYTWQLSGDTGVGDPKRVKSFSDMSFAVWGTWNSATVVLQGSWDPDGAPDDTSWTTLTEPDNTNPISYSSNDKGAVLESPIWVRPSWSGGDGSTSLTAVVSAPWGRF